MQRLLLVNPSPSGAKSRRRKKPARTRANPKAKGRAKTMARARRTAAQKRATRKMIAANRARARGKRRAPVKARRRRVRRNPATQYRQRRTYARTATMNPRRRRRRSSARRVRRNPIRMQNIMRDLLQPAAIGATGAIVNDALFTYLPIPTQFKTPGMMRYASKGISAVAMVWLASHVVKKETAAQLGIGALTQLSAEIFRNFIAQNVPALAPAAIEGMGYYNPAAVAGGGVGYYTNEGMGLYVPGGQSDRLPSLATQNGNDGVGMYSENGYSYS